MLVPVKRRQLWAGESRTARVDYRGWFSALDRKVRGVDRTVLYTGVSIQHWRRDDREREAGATATLPGAVRYRPRPSVPSKLDPNKAIIEARLAEYPKLTATRLFKEVREAGYPGSYSQVKRYVRRVRPRPPEEPVQRFETPPGHQGQVDFADFRLPWGKRHALIVVLGYSRLLWLRYYERQTMPVVMQRAGVGVPVLRGRPVGVAGRPDEGGDHRERPCRGRSAGRESGVPALQRPLGVRSRACDPYRSHTKGMVEWPIRYIRNNCFYGREFVSDDDLNARTQLWLRRRGPTLGSVAR